MEPFGVEQILALDPETRPETLNRSPLWEAYGFWFVAAYGEAAA